MINFYLYSSYSFTYSYALSLSIQSSYSNVFLIVNQLITWQVEADQHTTEAEYSSARENFRIKRTKSKKSKICWALLVDDQNLLTNFVSTITSDIFIVMVQ